jgi:DNA-binding ferritin-like protein (Dps family)
MLLEWRFKQIRFKEQKNLNGSNLYLYKSITSYIQNSDLRGIEKEEILQQIVDMMLQAQIEDKPMELILGNDYQEFCKSIIEEYSMDKGKNYRILNYIQKGLLWMIVSSVSFGIFRGILNSSFNLGITVDYIIVASLISFIILPATKKNSQENSSLTFWNKRFHTINNGLTNSGAYAFIIMFFIFGLIRYVLGKILSTEIFTYTITLYSCIPYVIVILLIIGLIEIYKRIYNKNI